MDKEKAPKQPLKEVEIPVEETIEIKETPPEPVVTSEKPKGKNGLVITVVIISILIILALVGVVVALLMTNNKPFGGSGTTPTPTVGITLTVAPTGTTTPTATLTPTLTVTPVPGVASAVTAISNPNGISCPTTFQFSAQITYNQAGTVKYKWEKSDATLGPEQTLTFAAAGTQTVTTSWMLSAGATGWMRVKITSPNSVTSNNASFTLTCDHSGLWYFNFGTMTINQTGVNVTAPFTNLKEGGATGTVSGTFTGSNFTGSYSGGTVSWTFNDVNNTFTGTWTGGGLSGGWCGAKAGSNFPAGCSYAGKWNEWVVGTFFNHEACQPGTQTMNLVRNNNTVSGAFCNGTVNGTITYSAPYIIYSGTFTVPGGSNSFHFYMNDYNSQTFKGNYVAGPHGWCGNRAVISSEPAGCLYAP